MIDGKNGQGTHCTKMSADTRNTPNYLPYLSAQAQSSGLQ